MSLLKIGPVTLLLLLLYFWAAYIHWAVDKEVVWKYIFSISLLHWCCLAFLWRVKNGAQWEGHTVGELDLTEDFGGPWVSVCTSGLPVLHTRTFSFLSAHVKVIT